MIEVLREHLVHMLHTHDGSRVAMMCLWHGTAKVRDTLSRCVCGMEQPRWVTLYLSCVCGMEQPRWVTLYLTGAMVSVHVVCGMVFVGWTVELSFGIRLMLEKVRPIHFHVMTVGKLLIHVCHCVCHQAV